MQPLLFLLTETMTYKIVHIDSARACFSVFTGSGGVNEYHVMISATDVMASYQQQLDAVLDAYQHLLKNELKGATAVFKRYFLSDAANQADDVIASDVSDCAKSIIEQAPLDGTKIALWAYLMTGVNTRQTDSGLYEATHGSYSHLWNGSAFNLAANSEHQMRLLFNEYVMQLAHEECTLEIGRAHV